MLSFLDFLKKYSTIPNQFLDDFFKLFNYESIDNTEKIVNGNDVIKWLDIHKHNLKKTLKKSYIKDVDYTISKIIKLKGKGGQTNEIIMLTIDCFKMLCQSTQSKKGKDVRRYFIDVEKLLNKYKSYIIEGLEDKVKLLQKNRKPKINPQKGVIYVFRTPDTPENNLYKIGRTIDLKKRLQSHSSGLSEDIDVLFIQEVDDVNKIEKCAKEAMKKFQYRKYKEVYQVNIDVIKFIIKNCDTFYTLLNETIEKENPKDLKNKKIFIYVDKD
jgi:phage anti-repressor protein/predicted GIY-YIG superfamily endonuclease